MPRNGFVRTSETFQALMKGKKTDLHSLYRSVLGIQHIDFTQGCIFCLHWDLPIREVEKIKLGA